MQQVKITHEKLEAAPASWARIRELCREKQQGSSLIEFAVALPVLLAILTGVFAFGTAFNNQMVLTRAVGAGAQNLQLIRTSSADPCADTLMVIENAAPSLVPASITLTLTFNGNSVTASSCSGDQSDLIQGQAVTVAAKYPCTLAIYGARFSAGCQLAAKVTEYEY